jgi:hypothetical protein
MSSPVVSLNEPIEGRDRSGSDNAQPAFERAREGAMKLFASTLWRIYGHCKAGLTLGALDRTTMARHTFNYDDARPGTQL